MVRAVHRSWYRWHGASHTHTQLSDLGLGYRWQGMPTIPPPAGRVRQGVPWKSQPGVLSPFPNTSDPDGDPVSSFPICCFPHSQGLWVSSFLGVGETKKRFASWVGSTGASSRPRQKLVNCRGGGGIGRTIFGFGSLWQQARGGVEEGKAWLPLPAHRTGLDPLSMPRSDPLMANFSWVWLGLEEALWYRGPHRPPRRSPATTPQALFPTESAPDAPLSGQAWC